MTSHALFSCLPSAIYMGIRNIVDIRLKRISLHIIGNAIKLFVMFIRFTC